ncbi:hypothetical protein AVEN_3846-1 [Araneus ventricosus]|uniref:oleoyl-[acyl-carrier-protein] hydrolase n=1 Tax=Araneus ventricosus TaxID=182803 RepID=A0A4Y2GPN4_ARAVE|nr:hypothetical protein AVEN_3846-1 [Araneus ventricosus]
MSSTEFRVAITYSIQKLFPSTLEPYWTPIVIVCKETAGRSVFDEGSKKWKVNRFPAMWILMVGKRVLQRLIQESVAGSFHVVGYSLGGSVAFEMAMQSQKCGGNLKTITLLSGSDDLMNALNKDDTETIDSEVSALCRFVEQFTSEGTGKLESGLLKETNQEQRIQMVVRYLTDSSRQTVDKNELSEALTCYLKKQKLLSSYFPSGKLSMDISIIESSTKILANDVARVKELFAQDSCMARKDLKGALSWHANNMTCQSHHL